MRNRFYIFNRFVSKLYIQLVVSGEAPTEPVISSRSGRVYERRLLQKYLDENNGQEPQTDHALTEQDIIAIQNDPPVVKPRPPTLTSIPALLSTFQNEWDALVLETFTLKQQYHQVRQELSQALYQNDASCRVAARLLKERDEARQALSTLQGRVGSMEKVSNSNMDVADASAEENGISDQHNGPEQVYFAKAAETTQVLSKIRMKREVPAELTSAEAWQTAKKVDTVESLHSTTAPGINTLALDTSGDIVLTGGEDNHAEVYARNAGKVIGRLKGHTKRVTAALWINGGGLDKPVITASADKTIRLWKPKAANTDENKDLRSKGWTKDQIVKYHKTEVAGLSLHPSGEYFASGAADGSWAIHAVSDGQVVVEGCTIDSHITQIAYHPDGALLGIGTSEGHILVMDVKQKQVLATLDMASNSTEEKQIFGIHFSENGYSLVITSPHEVAVWDLRKQKKSRSWSMADLDASNTDQVFSAPARFDKTGKYLAVTAAGSIHVFKVKGWQSLVTMSNEAGEKDVINDIQWDGSLSTGIASVGTGNAFHYYAPSSS